MKRRSILYLTRALANAILELGYAKSLAHPGGNVTGMEFQGQETLGKLVPSWRSDDDPRTKC